MIIKNAQSDDINSIINNRCSEDPRRLPHEKETGLHLEGDSDCVSVTSFKKVVYEKLLQRPDFNLTHLIVQDADGREYTVKSLERVLTQPSLRIIGVEGEISVGSLMIRKPRKSNSHARIVA